MIKFIVYNVVVWVLYFIVDKIFTILHIYQSTTPDDIFSYLNNRDITLIIINIAISLILGKIIMNKYKDKF